jgi:hypothetical protein
MDATKVDKASESGETAPIEAEVPAPGEMEAELPAENIVPLVNKVAVPPLAEMDKLIDELKEARTHLESEGGRIQREIDHYLQLSQNTVESIKIIAGAVAEWRNAGHPAE